MARRYGRRKRVQGYVRDANYNITKTEIKAGVHNTRVLPVVGLTDKNVSTMEFASIGDFHRACKSLEGSHAWGENESFRAGKNPVLSYYNALETMVTGNDSFVPMSDEMMTRLEELLPAFKLQQWERINDLVGGTVNVPRLVSGEPCHMIRRKRVAKQESPLSIFVDLICTCNVPDKQLMTRGAAILALTRILAARRPVTLYIGMQADKDMDANQCSMSIMPVDTAPLDLARAAYMFCHASFNRGMLYQYAFKYAAYNGHWAWNDSTLHRDRGQAVCKTVFGTDVLYIPPAMTQDSDYQVLVNDPVKWISERVIQYGMEGLTDD